MRQEADLDQALRGTLALEPSARRLSRLIEFLDATDAEGLHARLAPWCECARGDYAWVFDNDEDVDRPAACRRTPWSASMSRTSSITRSCRTPVTLYLFHLVRQLLDGRRLVCWMDEFWRLLADPAFESFAKDGPKTWRKLNGVMALATQSASDVLGSPISRTIIEQTPTKMFFPNADANAEDYMRRLRAHRAGVPADQGGARAGLAAVPGQAGPSERRVRARSQGLRRRARRDLRAPQRRSSSCTS